MIRLPYITAVSVRQTYVAKSRRKRQCFCCSLDIERDEEYINHQFRYDGKIITISLHTDCGEELIITGRKF